MDDYIFNNIEKPWWVKYYKKNKKVVLSLKDQRLNILKEIEKVCIDPIDYYRKNKKKDSKINSKYH